MGRGSASPGANELLYGRAPAPKYLDQQLQSPDAEIRLGALKRLSEDDPRRRRSIDQLAAELVERATPRDRPALAVKGAELIEAWQKLVRDQVEISLEADSELGKLDPVRIAWAKNYSPLIDLWEDGLRRAFAAGEPPAEEIELLSRPPQRPARGLRRLQELAADSVFQRGSELVEIASKQLLLLAPGFSSKSDPEGNLHLCKEGSALCGRPSTELRARSGADWAGLGTAEPYRCALCLEASLGAGAPNLIEELKIRTWTSEAMRGFPQAEMRWSEFRGRLSQECAANVVYERAGANEIQLGEDERPLLLRALSGLHSAWDELRRQLRSETE